MNVDKCSAIVFDSVGFGTSLCRCFVVAELTENTADIASGCVVLRDSHAGLMVGLFRLWTRLLSHGSTPKLRHGIASSHRSSYMRGCRLLSTCVSVVLSRLLSPDSSATDRQYGWMGTVPHLDPFMPPTQSRNSTDGYPHAHHGASRKKCQGHLDGRTDDDEASSMGRLDIPQSSRQALTSSCSQS